MCWWMSPTLTRKCCDGSLLQTRYDNWSGEYSAYLVSMGPQNYRGQVTTRNLKAALTIMNSKFGGIEKRASLARNFTDS